MTRRRSNARFYLDPYFACLILAGAGLGTWRLPTCMRMAILWTILLLLWLVYRENQAIRMRFKFVDLGRGAAIALAVGLPLLILAYRPLMTAIPILFVGTAAPPDAALSSDVAVAGEADILAASMFVSLVLLAPLAEELFFRDVLQREQGMLVGAALYAAAGLLFFAPAVGRFWLVLLAVGGVVAFLGVIYSFVYERYGLAVSIACHIVTNFVLMFIPIVLFILL